MRINRKAAREPDSRALVEIKLGHGAVLHARPLDSFEHKKVLAEARGELNALLAGEKPKRKWASIPKARIADAKADPQTESLLLSWMHAVLMAAACGVKLDGVEEIDDDGNVVGQLDAAFETFELLFTDVGVESAFKVQALKVEDIWAAEKNVSGPGPNGSGPEETTSVPPAETPATPAQPEGSEASAPAADSARTEQTPATPEKANSPGQSAAPAASGSSQD